MSFTSYWFVLALGVLFLVYYIIPVKFQWLFLLAASYAFYATAGWECLVYISVTTVFTYVAARRIGHIAKEKNAYLKANKDKLDKNAKKTYKESVKRKQRSWLFLALIVDLGLLVVLKYSNFLIANVNGIVSGLGDFAPISYMDIIMPLGISFYTFQSLGYLIDVYNEKYHEETNYGKFALFVGFFPQLSQGPISRYDDLSKTLYSGHKFQWDAVASGLQRILWGYFKKLVIADRVLIGLKTLLANPGSYQGAYFFVAMMFYALQLYADFTGGIDITIGIAEVLGIRLKENFNRPFFSKSIKEYWNRWHITMGSWFTDYVFYPVSVSKPMLKVSKISRKFLGDNIGKRVPVYLATLIVWFLTGIWHGASWNFVVWGLANCLVILVSQELMPLYRKFHNRFDVAENVFYKAFCVIRTVLLMSALRMFDCFGDVSVTVRQFISMFTVPDINVLWDGALLGIGLSVTDYCVIILGVVVLVVVSLLQRRKPVRERIKALPYPVRVAVWFGLFVVVILAGVYGHGYDASEFIYNRF